MARVRSKNSAQPARTPRAPLRATEIVARPHPLEAIFKDALDQVRNGKGNARHGQGRDFLEQTWLETAWAHGPAFLTGQAEKKLRESIGLDHEARRAERLGAIVYVAMSVIYEDLARGESEAS